MKELTRIKISMYILTLAMGVNIIAQYNGYTSMMTDRGLFIKVIVAVALIYVDYFVLTGVYQLLKYTDYDINVILNRIKK